MITEHMRALIKNGATIRAMFEEGKELSRKYGTDMITDKKNDLELLSSKESELIESMARKMFMILVLEILM